MNLPKKQVVYNTDEFRTVVCRYIPAVTCRNAAKGDGHITIMNNARSTSIYIIYKGGLKQSRGKTAAGFISYLDIIFLEKLIDIFLRLL